MSIANRGVRAVKILYVQHRSADRASMPVVVVRREPEIVTRLFVPSSNPVLS